MPVIKISKKVDFPSNLTPEDIIADIEASEPNDPLFEKSAVLFETRAHNKKTEDFQKLCKVIDELGFHCHLRQMICRNINFKASCRWYRLFCCNENL